MFAHLFCGVMGLDESVISWLVGIFFQEKWLVSKKNIIFVTERIIEN